MDTPAGRLTRWLLPTQIALALVALTLGIIGYAQTDLSNPVYRAIALFAGDTETLNDEPRAVAIARWLALAVTLSAVVTVTLAVLGRKMQGELDELCVRIYGHAGCEFNINSPKQLADILFTKMSLQPTKRTGRTKEISTAREVLEELALIHEMPGLVLRWREIQKLKGTYVDALPSLVNTRTGRVHTTFNQAVAATGRLSSSDPNLQNIPIRTALGREIRAAA